MHLTKAILFNIYMTLYELKKIKYQLKNNVKVKLNRGIIICLV